MLKPRRIKLMMDLAERLAQESKDPKLKVGCVVTDAFAEQPLGWGWNAGARGQSDDRESSESGESGLLHAEDNALLKTDFSVPDKIIFVTVAPCKMCAKRIINARVKEVYYKTVYQDGIGVDLMKRAGINCYKVEDKE